MSSNEDDRQFEEIKLENADEIYRNQQFRKFINVIDEFRDVGL